jgi:hypothetical protein
MFTDVRYPYGCSISLSGAVDGLHTVSAGLAVEHVWSDRAHDCVGEG